MVTPPFFSMDSLSEFLDFLYENLTGYVYAPLKTKEGEWERKYFQYPQERPELESWIKTASLDGNVYLSPALWKDKRAVKGTFKTSQVVWVEFDGQDQIDFKGLPKPDAIVQTSFSTHVHCYWRVEPTNLDTLESINRRLTFYLQADSSGWDATQVLRPPLTTNWKHDLPVELVWFEPTGGAHEFSSFDEAPEPPPKILDVQLSQLPDSNVLLKSLPLTKAVKDLVTTELAVEPHRSGFLMRLGYELAEQGCSAIQIISLLLHADERIQKFTGRSDRLTRIAEIAALAVHKTEAEETIVLYRPMEVVNHIDKLDWILPGWLHTTGFAVLTSAPGVGKTQFSLNLAYCLATGQSFISKLATDPKRVLFMSLEMDVRELKYIFSHQLEGIEPEKRDLWNENLLILDEQLTFVRYEEIVRETQPQVIILDSISELSGEELKEAESRTITRFLKSLRRKYGVAIWAIHHNRKATDTNKKPKKLSDLYGSFIFAKDADTVITLWEEDGKIELSSLKTRFGAKEEFKLARNANLMFERSTDASGESKPTGSSNPLLNFG